MVPWRRLQVLHGNKGIMMTTAEVSQKFDLARILNDNYIEMQFSRS
jgi:hypothetical protein